MITEKLLDFMLSFKYRNVPGNVRQAARNAILDYIGVAVAGSRAGTGKLITQFARESGESADSTVICGGFKTTPYLAALANGTMGHALDFDDECESWNSHPTVSLLPAVLALGEKLNSSGEEMITAYLLGWEVAAALGHTIYFKITEHGLHATAVLGTISSAVASAKLLNLNANQIKMALGIAGSQAAGLLVNFGTDTKPLHGGLAASAGVRSAQLAAMGFTANPGVLDDPKGFFWATAGAHLDVDLSKLGVDFDIIRSLCIKGYPCCYLVQRSVDSSFYLKKKHDIQPENVSEIEVKITPLQMKVLQYTHPQDGLQAKFSMQYSIASAFVYGRVSLEEYEDQKVLAPIIQEFIPKVKTTVVEGQTLEDYTHSSPGQLVTIKMKDGAEYAYDIGIPRGHAENPMDWSEIVKKFKANTAPSLSGENMEAVLNLVKDFQNIRNAGILMALLMG